MPLNFLYRLCNMFDTVINNLLVNIQKPDKPLVLDLILEGGAFNGSYELGVCFLLKELEKRGYITVNRISGASVGSIIGSYYLLDKLNEFHHSYGTVREQWRQSLNIELYKNVVRDTFENIPNSVSQLNDRLFITYNDIENKKLCVKSTYDNKDDLMYSIFKSCHIPYISGQELCEADFFFDGGIPYIFKDRVNNDLNKDTMYVNISYWSILFDSLNVSKEISQDGRILNGILKCYNLFLKKENNSMCSFMSKWKIQQFAMLRIKQILITFFLYIILGARYFSVFLHPVCSKYSLYNRLYNILKGLVQDVLIKCI